MNNSIEQRLLNEVYALLGGQAPSKSILDLIKDRQEDLSISERKTSHILGFERKSLQRLLQGETAKIDLMTFLKISHFLNIDVEKLTQIFVSSLSPEKIKELEYTRKATFIIENFNLEQLRKINFIEDVTDFEAIEQRIVSFLGLDSLFDYADSPAVYFSKTKRDGCENMRALWVASAMAQFEKIGNTNPYDREALLTIVPKKIKPYTRLEKQGLETVVKALYQMGITVIYQEQIPKLQIRGATMVYNDKPCIVLTNFGRYDTVWFALFHELYHVLSHLEQIQKTKIHISDDEDLFLLEKEANDFASRLLLGEDKLKFIASCIDSPVAVEGYAKKWDVHASVIYGLYSWHLKEHGDDSGFAKYQKYRPSPDEMLKPIRCISWDSQKPIDAEVNFFTKIKQ